MKNIHKYILSGFSVLLLVIAILSGHYFSSTNLSASPVKTFVPTIKKSLVLTLVERGLLHPARVEQIKSHISSNRAQLVWSVDEGMVVRKGQIIARFDTKPFMDQMEQAEQALADVVATLDAAKKNLSVKNVDIKGRIEAAQHKVEIAHIKANNLLNGSGRLQRKQLEKQVEQEARNLQIARQEKEDMKILLDKGHVSQREFEQTINTTLSAQDSFDLATAKLRNFINYEWPQKTKEAQLLTEAAKKELNRTKRTAELEVQKAQANIVKLERDVIKAKTRLNNTMADVAACDIRSPINGTLLYKELPHAEGRRKVQIGDTIWQGQTFMAIPDTTGMIVEIFVREIDVAKLHKGLKADIELDALPGKKFHGEIEQINSLATEEEGHPGIRTFKTIVCLNDISPKMHAGMSATVDIIYKEIKNTLTVPAQALNYHNSQFWVWKVQNNKMSSVPITVGAIGPERAQILSGLKEGESICLSGCSHE